MGYIVLALIISSVIYLKVCLKQAVKFICDKVEKLSRCDQKTEQERFAELKVHLETYLGKSKKGVSSSKKPKIIKIKEKN